MKRFKKMERPIAGKRIVLSLILSAMGWSLKAQVDTLSLVEDASSPLVGQLVIDGDTIPWTVLDEILFVPAPTLNDFSGTSTVLHADEEGEARIPLRA